VGDDILKDMATLEPRTSPSPVPAAITSIQPGSGLGMQIELAWGRMRRAWLRRFRPGYVRRMAGKRQGRCPECPHDILDPRDLKFYRNVCGYWFREEDDPFRWRARLPLARAGLAELVSLSVLFLLITAAVVVLGLAVQPIFFVGLVVVLPLWIFVVSFFRDPKRVPPNDPEAVLSPADGTITHVEEVDEPDFPNGRALRVSIFLSVLNVHVNRTPRATRVASVRYFPGRFLDARATDCATCNEQLWVDLDDLATGRRLRVKQISGAIARRIVCWLRPGDELCAGERFGMIKFGSRTDLLLPAGDTVDVKVKVGDKVKGGLTVLMRLVNSPSSV
jgi:phosphatidylserine decarboxylase